MTPVKPIRTAKPVPPRGFHTLEATLPPGMTLDIAGPFVRAFGPQLAARLQLATAPTPVAAVSIVARRP